MSKGRLKAVMAEKGVNVIPIYKVIEKNGEKMKVSHLSAEQGVIHYRAEPKRKHF